MHTGPNLQADLFLLLLRFRLFPVALCADVEQMYLRIRVTTDHHKYLKILYRFKNDKLRIFAFNCLPFGLKSSPYLAMRTIRQLASEECYRYPEAASVAESQLYMDDLVTSLHEDISAIKLSKQLISLFKSGGFNLTKWASNSTAFLNSLPETHRSSVSFSDDANNTMKVLGLAWLPANDSFFMTSSNTNEKCTKRTILSLVARLFDVLGLVAPVILFAKLLIKELWNSKIDWDDTPPDTIIYRYSSLVKELPLLSTIAIPRHIGVFKDCEVNIVAFCDASLNAYGCVVYLHITDPTGDITLRLLCSKSKVSPVKITTLARLELCAALVLSKLVKLIYNAYNSLHPITAIYAFSDSTIALSWIKSSPHRWSIFVGNRIAQIQENLSPDRFFHINGKENPSDCVSRGLLPSQIINNSLWWQGPSWACYPISQWPIEPFVPCKSGSDIPEMKKSVTLTALTVVEDSPIYQLGLRISSWSKLLRCVVYVLRFIRKLPRNKFVTASDLNTAEKAIIRALQAKYFGHDIASIRKLDLPSKNIRKLSPFIDEDGILRIQGRLSSSDLPFETQHPALLPKHDHIINIIVDYFHNTNLHTGPDLLMSIIRQRFWILSARNVIRKRVHMCKSCFRVSPSHPTPMMADLPSSRVMEAKAFCHTGVDYAGPFKITLVRKRGHHSQKAYICLFVCLTTKAIHIELASDLSTDSFLAAFKRFISRRGPVSFIYSDNGTNFVGAKAQLDEMYKLLVSNNFISAWNDELTKYRIIWKMIPPRAPHFGGLWESNIKSVKTHLNRVIGAQILTYEEMLTVLNQIECLMNSRPLCLLSADPNPEILTPAHFLMSTPLQYLPASELSANQMSLTNRKALLDGLVNSYWRKWRLEYLHTLQVRQKWCTSDNPVKVGTVVLIHQDDIPPLRWPLGVIQEVYPGADNIIRVALVKTKSGFLKRPVVKLYPLPLE